MLTQNIPQDWITAMMIEEEDPDESQGSFLEHLPVEVSLYSFWCNSLKLKIINTVKWGNFAVVG